MGPKSQWWFLKQKPCILLYSYLGRTGNEDPHQISWYKPLGFFLQAPEMAVLGVCAFAFVICRVGLCGVRGNAYDANPLSASVANYTTRKHRPRITRITRNTPS